MIWNLILVEFPLPPVILYCHNFHCHQLLIHCLYLIYFTFPDLGHLSLHLYQSTHLSCGHIFNFQQGSIITTITTFQHFAQHCQIIFTNNYIFLLADRLLLLLITFFTATSILNLHLYLVTVLLLPCLLVWFMSVFSIEHFIKFVISFSFDSKGFFCLFNLGTKVFVCSKVCSAKFLKISDRAASSFPCIENLPDLYYFDTDFGSLVFCLYNCHKMVFVENILFDLGMKILSDCNIVYFDNSIQCGHDNYFVFVLSNLRQ